MTVEQQARHAAGELRASVARTVSVEGSRRGLSSRLRRRRLEHGILTVVCIAGVTGAAALALRTPSPATLPATIPLVVPTASPAADCLFTVTCTDGTYRAALSIPTTFSPAGVLNVGSDTESVLDLDEPNGVYGMTVVAHPRTAGVSAGSGEEARPLALAAGLESRQDLVVLRRAAGLVAGRPAVVLDVTASPEASFSASCQGALEQCLPLFSIDAPAGNPTQVWLGRGQTVRVMLVEVTAEGTVAVLVRDGTTSGHAPAVAMVLVSDVLASLAFGEE